MRVSVGFMGPVLRPTAGASEVDLDLPIGATVNDLLSELGYIPAHVRHIGVFRDGLRLPHTAELGDGDAVTVTVPFGGG